MHSSFGAGHALRQTTCYTACEQTFFVGWGQGGGGGGEEGKDGWKETEFAISQLLGTVVLTPPPRCPHSGHQFSLPLTQIC